MKENHQKEKLEEGKTSLKQMMETLRPFLPKPDLAVPPPARKWGIFQPTPIFPKHDRGG